MEHKLHIGYLLHKKQAQNYIRPSFCSLAYSSSKATPLWLVVSGGDLCQAAEWGLARASELHMSRLSGEQLYAMEF